MLIKHYLYSMEVKRSKVREASASLLRERTYLLPFTLILWVSEGEEEGIEGGKWPLF